MHSKFKQNIINIYGSKGEQWLENLPDIINKIAQEIISSYLIYMVAGEGFEPPTPGL